MTKLAPVLVSPVADHFSTVPLLNCPHKLVLGKGYEQFKWWQTTFVWAWCIVTNWLISGSPHFNTYLLQKLSQQHHIYNVKLTSRCTVIRATTSMLRLAESNMNIQ